MHIDGCIHTFGHLAAEVLPGHMSRLRQMMQTPVAAAKICESYRNHSLKVPGCYVFLDQARPIYVGISRCIVKRIRQHCKGTDGSTASLAFRLAKAKSKGPVGTRRELMQQAQFRRHFEQQQARLNRLQVAYVVIENPLELYLFEAFAAMALGTHVLNTFETH